MYVVYRYRRRKWGFAIEWDDEEYAGTYWLIPGTLTPEDFEDMDPDYCFASGAEDTRCFCPNCSGETLRELNQENDQ